VTARKGKRAPAGVEQFARSFTVERDLDNRVER
jgi:hypothetical protein